MNPVRALLLAVVCWCQPYAPQATGAEEAALPAGVQAVWDADLAYHESTATRERVCLNGLWRWQPADASAEAVPEAHWGFFKVPGCWPGITDYMQKDSQTVFAHGTWKDRPLSELNAAWCERTITLPAAWSGRRISLSVEYLNSFAAVFIDGRKAGELRFPGGELDMTAVCRAGTTHRLSLLVLAMPLKGVALSYTDSAAAREVTGSVRRRGICGDVFLSATPRGPRLGTVKVDTSVRQASITVSAGLAELPGDAPYTLRARILEKGRFLKEFTSRPFLARDVVDGTFSFTEKWMAERLWDLDSPGHMLNLEVSLVDSAGTAVDVHEETRFGFRELWIDGRDFVLNGKRLHLSVVPLDNAQVSAAQSTYEAARETLERLKGFGINCVYTHNYDCEPGSHLSFTEILRAADDTGMLVSLTQPHFSAYDWKATDADASNGYATLAAFYAGVAGDHPSVVMYAMSHNAAGYEEDMNPDLIDGVHAPRDAWSAANAVLALRAEAIVTRLDPSRIVYHHASGNLGTMHPVNFYPNMVPIQELSDWFGHWAAAGVKPVFLCEYGAPFTWDWTMYRGWYKGEREFGSARVPWEFCLAEWNAQVFGDRAFAISETEKENLRWEAKQFSDGALWHRWDYPAAVDSPRLVERHPLLAKYLTDNWRAFRTWGVSAVSPWEYGHFWRLRDGVARGREDSPVDWKSLQHPGFSPDYQDDRFERMDLAFRREDWIATEAGEALLQNNRPLLGWIGGGPEQFTAKDHNYLAGEWVEKQLIVINDSRQTVTCACDWSFGATTGRATVGVPPGGQSRIPVRFELPSSLSPGRHDLSARFAFSPGDTLTDHLTLDVLPTPPPVARGARIALFDPRGETRTLLAGLGLGSRPVTADTDLRGFEVLVIGKGALTTTGPAPDITGVRAGLKVIIFEQVSDVLEQRFGFRLATWGMRQTFPRVAGHPALRGLAAETLHDWRGEATLLPARLEYELRPRYGPTVRWCGLPVPRLWRCGNRGNTASVLIEKPARGDFLPLLDGGFGLHYASVLEYHEGAGMVVFCQADVTGRTRPDPAADTLVRNLLNHVAAWKPTPRRRLLYAGDAKGRSYLESAGFTVAAYEGGKLSPDEVLVAGPGSGKALQGRSARVADFLKSGGSLLALGVEPADADTLLPSQVRISRGEHIAAFFEPPDAGSPLAGAAPADVHNRDPRPLPLVSGGAHTVGNGVLAVAESGRVVLCALTPWQFDGSQPNLRRTRRQAAVLVARLLANLGAAAPTPLLDRCGQPATPGAEPRWLSGFYLDRPEEWDDPYRFFRW